MAQYEVRVITRGQEFYAVEAGSAEEAAEKWSDGVLLSTEVIAVEDIDTPVLMFEDDDIPTYDVDFEDDDRD